MWLISDCLHPVVSNLKIWTSHKNVCWTNSRVKGLEDKHKAVIGVLFPLTRSKRKIRFSLHYFYIITIVYVSGVCDVYGSHVAVRKQICSFLSLSFTIWGLNLGFVCQVSLPAEPSHPTNDFHKFSGCHIVWLSVAWIVKQ